MYADDAPRLNRLSAALMGSWPLGSIAGIRIRLRYTALLVVLGAPLWMVLVEGGFSWRVAFLWSVVASVVLYLMVLTHELGHAWAARRVGAPVYDITLHMMGGLAHVSRPVPGPGAEIKVSIAGPAVHLLWLGPAWLLREHVNPLVVGNWFLLDVGDFLFQVNLGLLLFNLLPCYPMDGGRVLRGLLAMRLHPNLATIWACRVGIVGAIGLAAWGLSRGGFGGGVLVFIAISNFSSCLRDMTAARYTDGVYGQAASPWETDPDAWKSGQRERTAPRDDRLWPRVLRGRARSGPRREDSSVEAASTATATIEPAPIRTAEEDIELDRLLERVGRVGLTGLSAAERERLQLLSRHPKKGP